MSKRKQSKEKPVKLMEPARYPIPDRSSFKPNQFRDDAVSPEGDLGAVHCMLTGGRPCVLESWFAEGATFITLFFSTLALESATPVALLDLVMPVLIESQVPEAWRRLGPDGVHRIRDARDREIFSLTFVLREPEM